MECKVCQSPKASKQSYYGANETCTSCRGFFMRAVQTQWYPLFYCNPKVKCVIDSKNRRSCKKCRFEKCLEAGMKIKYVKTAQTRYRQIINQIEEPKLLTNYFVEKSKLEDLEKMKVNSTWKGMYQFFASKPDLFTKFLCSPICSVNGTEEFEDADRVWAFASTKYLTENDGVANDMEVLHAHNYQKYLIFSFAAAFKLGFFELQTFIEYGLKHRHESKDIDTLVTLIECYNPEEWKQCQIEYDTMFSSPWASHYDIEEEHQKLNEKIGNWYINVNNNSSNYDPCLDVLMELIFLYNTDGIETKLQNHQTIKNLQVQYANLLHKYLKSKTGENNANSLFSNALMLIHDTEKVNHLSLNKLKLE